VESRRVLLAVVLSLAVLIAWQLLVPAPEPVPSPPRTEGGAASETVRREAATAAEDARDAGREARLETAAGERAPGGEAGEPTAADEAAVEPVSAAAEERVAVETDLYRVELTNRGAQIVSFLLKDHRSHDGGPVDLVREREVGPYPFGLVTPEGEPTELQDALFAVERGTDEGNPAVVFRYAGPEGVAEKRFVFRSQGLFSATVTVERPRAWGLYLGPGLRNPSAEELENRFERRDAFYATAGGLETLDAREAEGETVLPGTGLRSLGLEDTYFLTAIVPQGGVAGVQAVPYLMERPAGGGAWRFAPLPSELTEEQEEMGRDYALVLRPETDRLDLVAYWGAKKYDRLAAMEEYGLEETVNLGWFGLLALPILHGLLWLHDNVVHNYGWAIVLMTLAIKVLLYPLTHKSYVSMQKMQQLNPRMQAIRAKWRGKLRDKQGKMNFDAQRQMNEEIRQLYAEEGVNPAGGCLPMLLQLPILFAFYQLLSTAVELRGAPWVGWIHDLSAPDPYYALPLIMGATQFIQQRMTPMAGDAMQRRIMQMMPLIWLVFFLGFPAGLVLYWLTNNVLTIIQQGAYQSYKKRRDEAAGGETAGKKKAPTRAPKTKRTKRVPTK